MPAGPAAASPLSRVLRWLAARDRSEREVRERLAAWGVSGAEAETVVATLRARRLIDDAALAERLCDWQDRHDPLGPLRLRERLARRGIPAALGEAAVAARAEEARQLELASALLARRGPALARLSPPQQRRRLHDYLARRGFSAAVRRRLCAALPAAADEDPGSLSPESPVSSEDDWTL